jgi:hypothetical protein
MTRPAALAAAAAGLSLLLLGAPARAGDAPVAPKPLPQVKHAYLDSLLGTWDVAVKTPEGDLKGIDVWSKAVDGTAYVHELIFAGEKPFAGLGVVRPSEDGKRVTIWWFDSEGGGDMATFEGTLAEDGYVVETEAGGVKFGESLKKTEGGLKYVLKAVGEEAASGTWTKAAKDGTIPTEFKGSKLGEVPFVKAQLGEWTLTGAAGETKYEGKSRIRLAVGGYYLVDEFSLQAGAERHVALGVYSVSADGNVQAWWFGNYHAPPMALKGKVAEKSWTLEGKHPGGAAMKVEVAQSEKGLTGTYTLAGAPFMKTTYARP